MWLKKHRCLVQFASRCQDIRTGIIPETRLCEKCVVNTQREQCLIKPSKSNFDIIFLKSPEQCAHYFQVAVHGKINNTLQ